MKRPPFGRPFRPAYEAVVLHLLPVCKGGADRRSVNRDVVDDRGGAAIGNGRGGDPVAGLARAALRSTEARHTGRAAGALADVLARVAVRDLVAVEVLSHAADVTGFHEL